MNNLQVFQSMRRFILRGFLESDSHMFVDIYVGFKRFSSIFHNFISVTYPIKTIAINQKLASSVNFRGSDSKQEL